MTREEAHRILSNGLVNAPSEHEWVIAFRMAIKALEQEPKTGYWIGVSCYDAFGGDKEGKEPMYSNSLGCAVRDGIPFPQNPTNGAVICMLYPNLRYTIHNDRVVTTIGVASSFDLDWWNAPYERGEG